MGLLASRVFFCEEVSKKLVENNRQRISDLRGLLGLVLGLCKLATKLGERAEDFVNLTASRCCTTVSENPCCLFQLSGGSR